MNEPTQAEIEVAARAQHEWTEANRARLGGYAPCAFDELSTTVKNMRRASMRPALTAAAQVRDGAGHRILRSVQQAIDGNWASVMIDGQMWERRESPTEAMKRIGVPEVTE